MPTSSRAIFLSYASQDSDAAKRICESLRAQGLEVWFDQSELRGGDAWDASIRKQIKECVLFVPIVSTNTDAREEGYFRLEWKLAVDRMHLMADSKPFLFPVILGDATEISAVVPDKFRERQWTRLAIDDDVALARFAMRVANLIPGNAASSHSTPNTAPRLDVDQPPHMAKPVASRSTHAASRRNVSIAIVLAVVAAIGTAAYYVTQRKFTTGASAANPTSSVTPAINPLSVMVMPFGNQTGDQKKGYVADALTSSITGDLSRIDDAFIVPAATAFSLADKKLTIPQLGKEAAVRFVLTGNVTGNNEKLRISAALSDTQTGAQLWTENFDGAATDLFALQDQVTIRIGNTIGQRMVIAAARDSDKRANKPAVADLLMRARALEFNQQSLRNHKAIEALYRKVLALEPGDTRAKLGLASTLTAQAESFDHELDLDGVGQRTLAQQAVDLAEEVRAVDSQNADVYAILASNASLTGDLKRAVDESKHVVALRPKDSAAHNNLGLALVRLGEPQAAMEALQTSLRLSSTAVPPAETYGLLSRVSFMLSRADSAIEWAQKAVDANPSRALYHRHLALAFALKGDVVQARRAAVEAISLNPKMRPTNPYGPWPGKEAAYNKFLETQFLPAWRLAGLPE